VSKLINKRHEAFCLEYMKDRNATAAYKRAGYAPKRDNTAKSAAARLLTNVDSGVPARIAELEAEFAERIGFEIEDILKAHVAIVRADPSKLSRLVRGACRYCHGARHDYQWRTPRELNIAVRKWNTLPTVARKLEPKPTDAGGFAYNATCAPHPSCPECDGIGHPQAHFEGYESIPDRSRPLFRGVEVTPGGGMKILMADIDASLDKLARHLGFYCKNKHVVLDTSDELTDLIMKIQDTNSKMPLTSSSRITSKVQ
jgi:phage terminase small subunit